MLCLKGMDLDLAAHISGTSKDACVRAKEFAKYVRDHYKDIDLSLRWVLLKGMTDTDTEIAALVTFAKELYPSLKHIELLPYHELGKEKYGKFFFSKTTTIICYMIEQQSLNPRLLWYQVISEFHIHMRAQSHTLMMMLCW